MISIRKYMPFLVVSAVVSAFFVASTLTATERSEAGLTQLPGVALADEVLWVDLNCGAGQVACCEEYDSATSIGYCSPEASVDVVACNTSPLDLNSCSVPGTTSNFIMDNSADSGYQGAVLASQSRERRRIKLAFPWWLIFYKDVEVGAEG